MQRWSIGSERESQVSPPHAMVRCACNAPALPRGELSLRARALTLLLHSTSGLGVSPSEISLIECDTTQSQYCVVKGTTSSGTPSCAHAAVA